MESLKAYRDAIAAPEFKEPRRLVCRTLASQLAACGDRLWAFGCGPIDFRTALSVAVQFGGSLGTGAVALGEQANWYAASALVRQFIEIQYLLRLFRADPSEAVTWLKASSNDLRESFSPSRMRMRLGGVFRYQEYRIHCEVGGHANPRAHVLLPSRVLKQHRPPLGSNEVFWIDLAQHLRRVWQDIEPVPGEHPNENLNVILQYTGVATEAIQVWEGVDPCSAMLPESLLKEWATTQDSA